MYIFATWKGMFPSKKTYQLTLAHKNVKHLKICTNAWVVGMSQQLPSVQM